ncbi:helix-turn-helix domain-containing protein [Stomatobaculum longum]|uniref:helix-turn-helix domain-containing protein n=1 Tax=Stomatobaculum longum TaxID=796942 RepID=UPI000A0024B3
MSERYLYRIENEGKRPSYNILYRMIRTLNVSADIFFYPEKRTDDTEVDHLLRMLFNADERALEVIKATATALINTAPEKQL